MRWGPILNVLFDLSQLSSLSSQEVPLPMPPVGDGLPKWSPHIGKGDCFMRCCRGPQCCILCCCICFFVPPDINMSRASSALRISSLVSAKIGEKEDSDLTARRTLLESEKIVNRLPSMVPFKISWLVLPAHNRCPPPQCRWTDCDTTWEKSTPLPWVPGRTGEIGVNFLWANKEVQNGLFFNWIQGLWLLQRRTSRKKKNGDRTRHPNHTASLSSQSFHELTKYGCHSECWGCRKCYRYGLTCTDLWSCQCEN